MSRNCPDCRQPLATEKFYDVDLELCGECAGIWFDAEELKRLLASDPIAMLALEERVLPHADQKKSHKGVLACPGCNGLLHVYHYQYSSPIELEACDECGGFWVQEGELSKMQQWHDAHHYETDSAAQRKLALANATIEHENALQRLANLKSLFTLLRQHRPVWLGDHR